MTAPQYTELIALARSCGMRDEVTKTPFPVKSGFLAKTVVKGSPEQLAAFAERVRSEERKRCGVTTV